MKEKNAHWVLRLSLAKGYIKSCQRTFVASLNPLQSSAEVCHLFLRNYSLNLSLTT